MVLTDREIQVALACKQVVIKPPPNEGVYGSTSLDLTLSKVIQEWTPAASCQIVCPTEKGYQFTDFAAKFSKKKRMTDKGYILVPGIFVLGWTKENIELPVHSRLAARVEGKSSLARLGIGIHVTAPTIHAGFKGQIQLEICNHGALKVKLTTGMRVCQLIFEQTLGTPVKGYSGQFYKQTGN
jgi:dCTP deaminase